MTKRLALSLAAVALFGIARSQQGQNEPKQVGQVDVASVRAVPQVYVALRLRTSDQQVFVPYCGESDTGEKILCTLGAHLEVRTSRGWRPAKLRTTYGVLGASSLGRAGGSLIAPRSEASFSFQFSRRFFEVEPGQQLRVVVDAWPDEQSMKMSGRSIQLTSPPFECPQTGTGR
jgi:hypothetical protein